MGKSKEDISFLFETRFINDRLTVCTGERKQIAFVERMRGCLVAGLFFLSLWNFLIFKSIK